MNRCTWSDKALGSNFAVDHVIPWSLWGSNDLWNLLPVDARVNGQKSDKLPSAALMLEKRLAIVSNWKILREAMPAAFNQQAGCLLGSTVGGALKWEDELFSRLREAVELTALQRGVERWAPS